MRGVYPEGFPDWEIAEIEKFRETNPKLYEWRKTAHLIVENFGRPRGTPKQLQESLERAERKMK